MSSELVKIKKRPAEERGHADHGWLNARFSFSFAGYHDPEYMGFRTLRVMNNDTIAPEGGFPLHPHESMEIFTYVVEGQLAHSDSMGNGATIEAGNMQYMSAGTGIRHSEFNPSSSKQTILYQIWLTPSSRGGEPRYAEIPLKENMKTNTLKLLFSESGRDGSISIRQNADVYFGKFGAGDSISLPASDSRPHSWIQVISGTISALGQVLNEGDGLAIEDHPSEIPITASSAGECIVFRLN